MMARRAIVMLVAGMMFSFQAALPALAGVTKSGYKYCNPATQTPASRALSYRFTEHFPPGSGYKAFNITGTAEKVTRAYSNLGDDGGFWFVEVTGGSLNDPGTYAYCSSII